MSFKKFLKNGHRASAQASIEFVVLSAVVVIAVLALGRPFLVGVGVSSEEAFERSVTSIMGDPTPPPGPQPPDPDPDPCPYGYCPPPA